MFSYITLPASTTENLFSSVGTLTTDLWVVIALAAGVPLAFYVIRKLIALVPKAR